MPGLGQPRTAGLLQRARDPEVGDQGVPAAQQDVLRLDVPVDDPLPVGVGQRIGHLARELERLVHRELRLAIQAIPQRLALDVRHHVVEETGGLTRVVQRQDMRVAEVGRHLDLAQEALGPEHVGQLGTQDLERHRAVMPFVARQVHGGHATVAESSEHAIGPERLPLRQLGGDPA